MYELDLRAIKAAVFGAGTEETRPYLHGVHLQGDGRGIIAAATNGHLIIALRASEKPVEEPFEIIIPSEAIKAMKAKDPEQTILSRGADGFWHMRTDKQIYAFEPLAATFPMWRKVVPSFTQAQIAGKYNPELLMVFVKAAKVYGLPPTTVEVWQQGENQAFVKIFSDFDRGFGVVMPFRGAMHYGPAIPDWAKETQPKKRAAQVRNASDQPTGV